MKAVVVLAFFALSCVAARADVLKLRDGRTVPGQFLGATRTEIWFQRDAPGEVIGTMAYPIVQVESLTFAPDARGSVKSQGAAFQMTPQITRAKRCEESQG